MNIGIEYQGIQHYECIDIFGGAEAFEHRKELDARKEKLCEAVWGTSEYIDENALQVNLTRLKKTMAGLDMKAKIIAVRGVGYKLE